MTRKKLAMNLLGFIYGNCRIVAFTLLFIGAAAVANGAENAGRSSVSTRTPASAPVQVPAYFERNKGQFPTAVRFAARMSGYTAWFTDRDVILTAGNRLHPTKVHMQFVGSGGHLQTGDSLPGKVNYFVGSDATKWQRGVPIYEHIIRQHAYPGINVIYRIARSELEYDLVVAPGADPNRIKLHFTGAKRVRVDKGGDLVLSTAVGEIRQRKPDVYEESSAGREPLKGRFVLLGKTNAGFVVAAHDRSRALLIDPAIVYSTFLGTASIVNGYPIGQTYSVKTYTDPADSHVYIYVTGQACPAAFSPASIVFGPSESCVMPFIAKLDTTAAGAASLVWVTFLGGVNFQCCNAPLTHLAVDSLGNAYVAGSTSSPDFPVVNGYRSSVTPNSQYSTYFNDAFLAKISTDGSTLLYSTYFGGSGGELVNDIAVGNRGIVYIAGTTFSSDLPTRNPFQSHVASHSLFTAGTGFVTGFDTTQFGDGSLAYSTYVGNTVSCVGNETALYALALDAAGTIHVGGASASCVSFPFLNGFQGPPSGSGSGVYARLNPALSGSGQLLYSTYIGWEVTGVAVDSLDKVYLTGVTGGFCPLRQGRS